MTVTSTRTVAINAAFLREIQQDNEDLAAAFQKARMFSRRQATITASSVLGLFSQLRDLIAMHFALEEAVGYIDDAIDVAPRTSRLAEQLRDEHATLYLSACELAEEAERLAYMVGDVGFERLFQAFLRFDKRWRVHERRENNLIYHAYFDEIGYID